MRIEAEAKRASKERERMLRAPIRSFNFPNDPEILKAGSCDLCEENKSHPPANNSLHFVWLH